MVPAMAVEIGANGGFGECVSLRETMLPALWTTFCVRLLTRVDSPI
jgi:hypothetical protein